MTPSIGLLALVQPRVIPAITTRSARSLSLSLSSLSAKSLIAPEDDWGNAAALTALSWAAQTVGPRTTVGRLLGAPVSAMALVFVLASVRILPPGGSTGSRALQALSLKLATPLLLLSADFSIQTLRSCGPLLVSFLWASLGTLLAASGTMAVLLKMGARTTTTSPWIDSKIAAALMAKNIGGGINYAAVCQTLRASPAAVAAGLCVDNIFALVYFPWTSALGQGRRDPADEATETGNRTTKELPVQPQPPKLPTNSLSVEVLSAAIALAALCSWVGDLLGGTTGSSLPVTTAVSILLTCLLPSDRPSVGSLRNACGMLGTSLLYLFFATAGAPGLAINDASIGMGPLAVYLSGLYAGHAAVLLAVRYVTGALPQHLLVASSAAIGGPATACALAQDKGWHSLVGPSLLVGNLGYALATFLGIAFYNIVTASTR